MKSRTETVRTRRRPLGLFVVFALLCAVCALGVLSWGTMRFEKKYTHYMEEEALYVAAAIKPGHEANPIRVQVNQLLSEVVQVQMAPEERLEKARQGIAHLNDMENQIDAIKDHADIVQPLLQALDSAANGVLVPGRRAKAKELVAIGKRQIEIISDIRGLSYRADYYTDEVFERIIDDQGEMTDAHTQHLNDLIPQLEEQFDRRTNLYRELQTNSERMQMLAQELGYGT